MIDWRSFPPLSALRAFLAFAEAETLDQAGARIGVTHAAISQQIRSLEAHLGRALGERGGRRLALTADGRRLAESLAAAKSSFDASPDGTIQTIDWQPSRRCSSVFHASGKGGSLRPRSIRYW